VIHLIAPPTTTMRWTAAATAYAAAYVVVSLMSANDQTIRLWVGNIGLLRVSHSCRCA